MTASFYDVVILGTHPGALLCGALLAKRGFRVLHLGQDDLPPTYAAAGLTLPRAPFTFLAAHSEMARRVFSELALHQLFRRRAAAPDPAFQVAMPRHRFDLSLDEKDLEREIEREFPEVKRPIEDFFENVARWSAAFDRVVARGLIWPPETFFERRELARAVAHKPFDKQGNGPDLLGELSDEHPFRFAVHAPVRFATGMDPDDLTPLAIARLHASWTRGAATVEGGQEWIRQMLFERILAHSGEIRVREKADRILLKRNVASGVRIAGSGEEIGCAFVIAGSDIGSVLRIVPDRGPFEELFERVGEPQPRYFRYTLNVVCGAEGVPVGMARDVFVMRSLTRTHTGENVLRVEVHPPDAQGRRILCCQALLPRREIEDVPSGIGTVRERVLETLREVVPFFSDHVHVIDSPHDGRNIEDKRNNTQIEPDEPWTRGPSTMETVYRYPVPGVLGVTALPVRTPIRRLFLCNGQVVPGLGMEGSFLAAWSAARIITRADRKKEAMRRGLWTKVEI